MLASDKSPTAIDQSPESIDPAQVARRTTKLSQEIGQRLTTIREARGITERDLARLAHMHHVSVHRTCHGEGGNPNVGTILDLAKALRVNPAWLAFGIGPREEPDNPRDAIKQAIASLPFAERKKLLAELCTTGEEESRK